jgi:Family with sequence similarity 184, A and B
VPRSGRAKESVAAFFWFPDPIAAVKGGTMASSSPPIEAMHSKMSKKIAQLTKVIYHLNTRNEDHQSEMDALSYAHQMELQQLARDAARKMSKFKDLAESKNVAATLEAQMSKMKKQFEAEKQKALLDLEGYKEKTAEREKRLAHEYQTRADKLSDEVAQMNTKFQEKVSTLEGLNQDLRKALDATRSSSSAGVDELKRAHQKELAELKDALNTAAQRERDALRAEQEAAAAAAATELTQRLKAEAEQQLGQVRTCLAWKKIDTFRRGHPGRHTTSK